MAAIPWDHPINFASALLLHSCITVLLKELANVVVFLKRFFALLKVRSSAQQKAPSLADCARASVVLDAYTSIMSDDRDGVMAELYYTNTGIILLAVSLASSVGMNMLLSDRLLNGIVAGTFGLAWFVSLWNCDRDITLPILALRRAGRFIWSDTPFINFFSLIYVATVLKGQASLRLQDYVTFRGIAILELAFMKAKLAASSPEAQEELMRQLIRSEWVALRAVSETKRIPAPGFRADQTTQRAVVPTDPRSLDAASRHRMTAFKTSQRLSVMLFKTSIGHHFGCLEGAFGPVKCPAPEVGRYVEMVAEGYKIYRMDKNVMIIADCLNQTAPKGQWGRFKAHAHGILLRRAGRIRVIYLVKDIGNKPDWEWHSNVNLVTGVSKKWLEETFVVSGPLREGVVAGLDRWA